MFLYENQLNTKIGFMQYKSLLNDYIQNIYMATL